MKLIINFFCKQPLLIGIPAAILMLYLLAINKNPDTTPSAEPIGLLDNTEDPIPPDNYNLDSMFNQNLSYRIVETEFNNLRTFNVTVRIKTKLSHENLKIIATDVKRKINAGSERGIVFFLLPEMKLSYGAWASVKFTDTISVYIIGQSIEEEQLIENSLNDIHDYEGLWADNGTQGEVIMRIRLDQRLGHVLEYIDPNNPKPSILPTELNKRNIKGKVVYYNIESSVGEYYVVEPNGDLTAYDIDGHIFTFKRIK